jgi:putative membrane protein
VTPGHPREKDAPDVRLLTYLVVCWALNAAILAIVAWIFVDVHAGTTGELLAAAAIFGVLNTVLKPLLRLITLPLAIVTLGIAWFGVSMLMLWITDALVKGFDVRGFWTYVGATAVIWLLNAALDIAVFFWLRKAAEPSPTAALVS